MAAMQIHCKAELKKQQYEMACLKSVKAQMHDSEQLTLRRRSSIRNSRGGNGIENNNGITENLDLIRVEL